MSLLASAFVLIGIAGCGEDMEPEKHVEDVPTGSVDTGTGDGVSPADTATAIVKDMPEGVFQFPTSHTPVPDVWMQLPEGYEVKTTGKFPNDEFYLFRSDDPSLTDPNAVTTGFMKLYIGVKPGVGLKKGEEYEKKRVLINKYPTFWLLDEDTLPEGGMYYKRELRSDDFFAGISPELAQAPLHLHIYVAGSDSLQVAELMDAARTFRLANN